MKQSDSLPNQNKASGNMNHSENKENYFSALKSEDYSGTFPEIENWLYKTNIQIENQSKERKLRKMKKYFLANKLRLVYPIIFLAVLIAACSMPVTQTETAGSMMTWTVAKDNTEAQNKIILLPWLKNANLTSNENVDNGKAEMLYMAVLPNTSQEQINSYRKELESIGGITSLKINPINYDVKRPLYSAALNNFFRIDVDGSTMNDKELEEQVVKKFKDAGMDNCPQINFTTDANGKRTIKMKVDEQSGAKNFELNVKDGNNEEKLKVISKTSSDFSKFKGKSDDEIRKMVREDLENPNLKDSEIKITRGDNGDVKIKVEAERQEVKPGKDK
jgi:hypothetical protein